MSEEEAEINEKQSECDNSINMENESSEKKNNASDCETDIEEENNDEIPNKKDYSTIVIDVL